MLTLYYPIDRRKSQALAISPPVCYNIYIIIILNRCEGNRAMKYKISQNVIKRLPRYLRYLDMLGKEGVLKVSSGELGRRMGLTASQIRQDLNCFGGFGQQGYGYNVAQLRDGVAAALGLDKRLKAVIVGIGNLGRALALNFRFEECGAELVAAFDVDPAKVGTQIGHTAVYHVSELESFIRENSVDVAVLTLPRERADEAAASAAAGGVAGIWNFTGDDLSETAPEVFVENVHLSDSMLTLGYYLRSDGGRGET